MATKAPTLPHPTWCWLVALIPPTRDSDSVALCIRIQHPTAPCRLFFKPLQLRTIHPPAAWSDEFCLGQKHLNLTRLIYSLPEGSEWIARLSYLPASVLDTCQANIFGSISFKTNVEIVSASTFGQETGMRLSALTCSHSSMLVPIYQLRVAAILLTATTSQGLAYNCEELPWGQGWADHLVASLQESRAWNPPGLRGKKKGETYDRKGKADQGLKVPVGCKLPGWGLKSPAPLSKQVRSNGSWPKTCACGNTSKHPSIWGSTSRRITQDLREIQASSCWILHTSAKSRPKSKWKCQAELLVFMDLFVRRTCWNKRIIYAVLSP